MMQSPDSHSILLVEDDRELASMVAEFLAGHEFAVTIEGNGTAAIQRIAQGGFDCLLLDIGLPGTDGISICRQVRSSFAGPIVMLTARGDEIDEVVALEVGADDYISKPVRPRALLARLRVHLRRAESSTSQPARSRIEVDGLTIDSSSRSVLLNNAPIELTTAEFDLLWLLSEKAGTVVPREQLYRDLHGVDYDGMDRSIDLRVSRLRKKIGDDPNHPTRIKSVRGVGYLLATES